MSPQIVQSQNDKRSYRRIYLANGLTCLLIHDPEIDLEEKEEEDQEHCNSEPSDDQDDEDDQSEDSSGSDEENHGKGQAAVKNAAVAMAVGAGSWADPKDLPGLAHYLEHMLFMGSEKYPDENEYENYLTKHGGYSNAFTECEYTVFYFDVKPTALYGALDRFAQFFIAPLCKSDSLQREVEAVDSEFKTILQDDSCRLYQLTASTGKPDHCCNRFAWGNKQSLWDGPIAHGTDIRARIMEFYRDQYSAERMSLVVLGGESLDTLSEWVQDMLCMVPAGVGPMVDLKNVGYPFEGHEMCVVSSAKNEHTITVNFQLPSLRQLYRKKADEYISHLVGHEGPGSLLSALKEKRWAVDCEAGVEDSCDSMNSFVYIFEINITLTDAGLMAGPGLGLGPVMMIFQYLKMLQSQEPQVWVFEELRGIGEMKFRFLEETESADYVTNLSSAPFRVDLEHVLKAPYLYEDWDPVLVSSLLDKMVPDAPGLRIILKSQKVWETRSTIMDAFEDAQLKHEPWFGVDYIQIPINKDMRKSWNEAVVPQGMNLPPRNPYIPQDFTLKCNPRDPTVTQFTPSNPLGGSTEPLIPELLVEEPGIRLWHLLDDSYRSPKTNILIRLAAPIVNRSPRDVALVQMVIALWEESLNEQLYLADAAGLRTNFASKGAAGIELRINGFSDKLPLLVLQMISALCHFKTCTEVFATVHETVVRKYENSNMKVDQHSQYVRLLVLSSSTWDISDVLHELRNVQLKDVQDYVVSFLEAVHLEGLVHGNTTADEALDLFKSARASLGPGLLQASDRPVTCCAQLSKGTRYAHRLEAKNSEEVTSSMELYFQFETVSTRQKALADLVDQLLFEPCYNTLRTIEQLGYSVSSSCKLSYGILGFCFSIVSEKHAPFYLENRVEAFLQQYEDMLKRMSEDEFLTHKKSLISCNLQKDQNLGQATWRMWEQIASGHYDFDSRRQQVAEIKKLTKNDVMGWYSEHLSPSSSFRRMLVVNVVCEPHWAAELEANPPQNNLKSEQFQNVKDLRRNLPYFPAMINGIEALKGLPRKLARVASLPGKSLGRVLRF